MSKHPDLVLLSHHKCATNWLRSICRVLDEKGLINSQTVRGTDKSGQSSSNSSALNVLINVNASQNTTKDIDFKAQPIFHVVRDPRDALVSNYWSWLKSHSNNGENILKFRERAVDMSVHEGLIELLHYFPMGKQLLSWTDEMWEYSTLIRFEDMLEDLSRELDKIFSPLGLKIPDDVVAEIVDRTSFEKMSKGRKPGEEDVGNHYRKGVSGDWRNYFEPELSRRFHDVYGDIGARLGYFE